MMLEATHRFAPFAKRLVPAAIAVLVAALALAVADAASAARNVSTSGTPGNVYEPLIPASCYDYVLYGYKHLEIDGPSVEAAALRNGSRGQYVRWSTDVTDEATGVTTPGSLSAWSWVPLGARVTLPVMSGAFTLFHRLGVRVHIQWWDPTSGVYTGAMDYTINAYTNFDYAGGSFSTVGCGP